MEIDASAAISIFSVFMLVCRHALGTKFCNLSIRQLHAEEMNFTARIHYLSRNKKGQQM